jgi:hypothetical protein
VNTFELDNQLNAFIMQRTSKDAFSSSMMRMSSPK